MASWQARVAAFIVRRRVKPALGDMRDIGRVRKVFDTPLPEPRGVRYTDAVLGGVPGEWVEPIAGAKTELTILYLHGGGFVGCSPRTHRPLTASLALQGARLFVPDYRLAPEHPFPAAVEDVCSVWRAMCAEAASSRSSGRLTVAGDSAGGNLALVLLLAMRDAGERLPDAAALFSPATDLTGGSASLQHDDGRDPMFEAAALEHLVQAYLAGADPAQPLVSPLLGDLAGLPPLLVHVGADEVLRDDSLRLAEKARAAGVRVELQVFPTVPHVWQMMWRLPEAKRSVRAAVRFLREAARIVPAADRPRETVEHRDVIIVGAGLSGIGAAAHLQDRCPAKTYAILEARDAIGGTWDLFRYPGIRSDSDMYTLGYLFKPWTDPKSIADGPSIRRYVIETATERGIDRHIRFGRRVVRADWSSSDARWTVEVEHAGGRERCTCGFLLMCSGYYSYAEGYRPAFPGEASFRGTLVHPQFWPADLDYAGKRVVVIGSGATAVTLVPEMAKAAAHVTMLQRSPTYMVSLPSRDAIAGWLRRWLPATLTYRLVRLKNVLLTMLFFNLSRKRPAKMKERLIGLVRRQLPRVDDVDRHFTPRYNPWEQRLCVVPDGDLFKAIRNGSASIVTDAIETFTERGVRLASGRELEADIVVTATGLKLNVLGDVAVSIDGQPVRAPETMTYKGMMFSDVPNLAYTFGYTNASWTLKADLTAGYVCRLLRHMDRHGYEVAMARRDPTVATLPFLDFSSGYVQRALDVLPKQGDRKPWRLYQNYLLDLMTLRWGRIEDGTLQLSRRPRSPRPSPAEAETERVAAV